MSERIVQQKKARRVEQPALRQSVPDAVLQENQALADPRSFTAAHFGHDFSQISVLPPSTAMLQTKLTVNVPGDQFEQEADQVAEEVMRMEAANGQSLLYAGEQIQRKAPSDDTHVVSPDLQANIAGMRGGGQPLDQATRDFMEPRFGHSFANVHVHTNDCAVEASQAVHALAFTVGQDIAFGAGQYQPSSDTGRRLLAHELTHVVQQTGMVQAQHIDPFLQREPSGGSSATPALQRVQDAIAADNMEALIAIQHELRKQMLTDPLHPPEDARVGLATARHLTMDRIAAIRDTYATQIAEASTGGNSDTEGNGPLETIEILMDAECTPYLDALMEGDPQYRYEHFNTTVSEKVFAAVRLHSARRGVGRIGHRDEAEAEARKHGKLPTGAWCGAFAHTQAEQGGGFDPHWAGDMQGEGGIRTALAYGGAMAHTWIWAFDHWETLKAYHESRGSMRWYEAIDLAPPKQGIQAGDLVLKDNAFGTNPDHITTAISFDGRFLTTVGGNQGSDEKGVSRSTHAFDLQNNPKPNDVTNLDAQGKAILNAKGDRTVDPSKGPKHERVHGIGRWSVVDYELHIYNKGPQMPTAPPSAAELAKLG